jgi:hypothetical protein
MGNGRNRLIELLALLQWLWAMLVLMLLGVFHFSSMAA